MAQVAFIGLGAMGYPMAGHLARAGHQVTVFNRTAAKAAQWAKDYPGQTAPTPRAAAATADFVMACVGNDDDLRQVTLGDDGAFHAMRPGAIFVDHTTSSATVARELYAAAQQRGLHFLDAPVSGGQGGAQNGVLTIMTGGDAAPYALAADIMRAYGKTIQHMGPSGSGQLTKMVNQICIVGIIESLAEGLNFAKQAQLDLPKVIDAISGGAAGSWQLSNRAKTMVKGEFDFGFAVEWMRKDLGICLAEAKRNGATLPVTAMIDQFYAEVEQMGGRRWDTSSLIQRFKQKSCGD
jgi:3-hydroxyisobutyrate dehydrogenase